MGLLSAQAEQRRAVKRRRGREHRHHRQAGQKPAETQKDRVRRLPQALYKRAVRTKQTFHSLLLQHGQPLTPLLVMPCTKYFWKGRKMQMGSSAENMELA